MKNDPDGRGSDMVARPVAASSNARSLGPNRPPETGSYQRVRERELVVKTPGAGRAATRSIVPPKARRVSCGLLTLTIFFNHQALPWLLESSPCLPTNSRACRRRIGSSLVIVHKGIGGHFEGRANRGETGVVASWLTSATNSFPSLICLAPQDQRIAFVRLLTFACAVPLPQAIQVSAPAGKLLRLHVAVKPGSWKENIELSGVNGRTH